LSLESDIIPPAGPSGISKSRSSKLYPDCYFIITGILIKEPTNSGS